MVNRRSFLMSLGTIALAQWLGGCSDRASEFKVVLLQGSIPAQLLGTFRKQVTARNPLSFKPEVQIKDLFNLLKSWQEPEKPSSNWLNWLPFIAKAPPKTANLVTLGDYWLAEAIASKLVRPLDLEELESWQNLPDRWQQLVRRNERGESDGTGKIWGAPYRWGSTVIAYRRDKFEDLGWTPRDWQDLWREELRGRISLLDEPREVLGLVAKKLGKSYNESDLSQIPDLKSEFSALHRQVKFYSTDNYLPPLILGDTWLAVGWSNELLPLQERYEEIEVVVPRSGTALWADLWVQPASLTEIASQAALTQQWIDFCWQSKAAIGISLLSRGTSPAIAKVESSDLSEELRKNPLNLLDPAILDNSEFLLPLSPSTVTEYERLWQEVRSVTE